MIKRRDIDLKLEIMNNAIKNGDIEEVKNLIENCNMNISKFTYMAAVIHKQLNILKYFLEKDPSVSYHALSVAVKEWDEEMIKTIIVFWKNNRKFCEFNIGSAIISAISNVTDEYRSVPPQVTISGLESETLRKVRFIIETYNE